MNSLEVIEMALDYITKKIKANGSVFGGQKISSLPKEQRLSQAVLLSPILRGLCSSNNQMIGHFSDSNVVLEYINSNDLKRLAPMGTSCPDHFLRTKIAPLILELLPDENLEDSDTGIDSFLLFCCEW